MSSLPRYVENHGDDRFAVIHKRPGGLWQAQCWCGSLGIFPDETSAAEAVANAPKRPKPPKSKKIKRLHSVPMIGADLPGGYFTASDRLVAGSDRATASPAGRNRESSASTQRPQTPSTLSATLILRRGPPNRRCADERCPRN